MIKRCNKVIENKYKSIEWISNEPSKTLRAADGAAKLNSVKVFCFFFLRETLLSFDKKKRERKNERERRDRKRRFVEKLKTVEEGERRRKLGELTGWNAGRSSVTSTSGSTVVRRLLFDDLSTTRH